MKFIWQHIKSITADFIHSFQWSYGDGYPIQCVLFFTVSVIFGVSLLVINNWILPIDLAGDILTILSILLGLLINMLIPFFAFIESSSSKVELNEVKDAELDEDKKVFLRVKRARIVQYRILFTQVQFAVLSSVMAIFCVLIFKYLLLKSNDSNILLFSQEVPLKHVLKIALSLLCTSSLFVTLMTVLKIVISSYAIVGPLLKEKAKL